MRFASGVSDSVQIVNAAKDACQNVLAQLAGAPCSLALVFASVFYRAKWQEALELIHSSLRPSVMIGCSGIGVVGQGKVFEEVPAISVVGASLPGVSLYPFTVNPIELEFSKVGDFWNDKIGLQKDSQPIFLIFSEGHSSDPMLLVSQISQTFPKRPIIGGLASEEPDTYFPIMFSETEMVREGAVGLAMAGPIAVDCLISNNCRPIGKPFVITKAEDNIVLELGGRHALEVLREALLWLPESDQDLAQHAIVAGLVIDEMKPSFHQHDFLIRSLIGIDPPTGAIAIADRVEVGKTLQFHLRDPNLQSDDINEGLSNGSNSGSLGPPSGALFFDSVGQNKNLFKSRVKALRKISSLSRSMSLGGCLFEAEICPLGGNNFVHECASSLAIFRKAG